MHGHPCLPRAWAFISGHPCLPRPWAFTTAQAMDIHHCPGHGNSCLPRAWASIPAQAMGIHACPGHEHSCPGHGHTFLNRTCTLKHKTNKFTNKPKQTPTPTTVQLFKPTQPNKKLKELRRPVLTRCPCGYTIVYMQSDVCLISRRIQVLSFM
jgi:hypothetical protein